MSFRFLHTGDWQLTSLRKIKKSLDETKTFSHSNSEHGSKKMIYEVYGHYVEGLEKDAGKILGYLGKDFMGLQEKNTLPFAMNPGESFSESYKVNLGT